ncbi:MAG: energy transducer TonB [Rhodanobacter sp.]
MLRLRTTTGLSVLALAIGIAGTGWLSTLTARWPDAPRGIAASHDSPASARPLRHRRHAVVPTVRQRALPVENGVDIAQAAAAPPPTRLQPLATPAAAERWDDVRGHLDGQLTVQLRVDGEGRVQHARVLDSSGDPILDAHALRSVQGWRFAVPPGHPDGLSGELPMRFSSQDGRVGML